jgi:hypothetical protein
MLFMIVFHLPVWSTSTGISDLLLIVLSGMCREALRLLKESHADKKNGLEVQYREAHVFL